MSANPLVSLSVEDNIATICLNDAARMNPISIPLQQELLAALQTVAGQSDTRALILTAEGRGFCVGADLSSMSTQGETQASPGATAAEMMDRWTNPIILGLRQMRCPVICAINGAAAGGGAGLALAGDVVVAARSAYFYLPFLPRLGIVPDCGTSWMLPRYIGRARSTALALLDERLSAERAAEWGLVWECVDDQQLPARAREIATRLAALPPHAVQEARALFDASEKNDLAAQLAYERDRQRELIDGPCFAEGVSAFVQKRAPRFDAA